MKTFYSIVSIATKPFFDEKISVGLLCINDFETYFHFSSAKLKWVGKFLSNDAKTQALNSLKSIAFEVKKSDIESNEFFINSNLPFSSSYLNYLSRYNNNLVQFSAPIEIEIELNSVVFEKLFHKYIFAEEKFQVLKTEKKQSIIETFRNTFKPKIKQYANTDFTVNHHIIKDLITPITVDLFGKNGAFVTGQAIDFSKETSNLAKDINSYMYLALATEMNDSDAKCYLLGEEPKKDLVKNHQIWNNARKAKNIEFLTFDESEKVIEYLERRKVRPIENF
jgi:hypothetical protein